MLLFYFLLGFIYSTPIPPLLPEQFTLPLDEWSFSGETTSGNWVYDSINDRGVEEHYNSSTVYWCSSTGLAGNYPCRITSLKGKRFIIFPFVESIETSDAKCCFCCYTSTCGGIVSRNWLDSANYNGETIVDNQEVDIWTIKGVDDNWWYTNLDTGIPVRYTEKSHGKLFRNYTYHDIKLGPPDEKYFNLPSSCVSADLCSGFCEKWRD